MKRKLLFLDRDGTLIEEPADEQIDAYEKFALVPEVIPSLRALRDAGYAFVMVSNQDGLGTASFPREVFEGPQRLLLQILASQGITFEAIHIDDSRPQDGRDTRKPGLGMVMEYLRRGDLDFARSAVIGDRETDLVFARNLGVRGFRLGPDGDWPAITRALLGASRQGAIERNTAETRVRVHVDLDAPARATIATGIGFFDHMLEQLARHGGFALDVHAAGDLHVDEHHTVEDVALALGGALREALGDKRGIGRYGDSEGEARAARFGAALPMDEARAEALIDLSGRPSFVFEGRFPREQVGELPTEMVVHFFRSLSDALGAALHLRVQGENTHHLVEGAFKAVARALRPALRRDGVVLPSTKGVL